MTMYSKRAGIHGATIYTRNKRPMKTADVPANIMKILENQDSIDDENMQLEAPNRKCLFCGTWTKLSRIINGQTVYICEEHYYSKTTGQVAQQIRLNEEAKT